MRKLFLLAFLLSCIATAHAQRDKTLQFKLFESKNAAGKMKFKASPETNNYDIIYHRMLWEVDPAKEYIKGEVTSYFKAKSANVSSISFDLIDALEVDSVTQNGRALSYLHENNLVKINLTRPINSGVLDSLSIYYKGIPQSLTGFGSFVNGYHENVPILWTLSEPYGAREWWPCKQSLTDKIDSVDIYIKTPQAYRVGSNGKLIFEKTTGDKKLTYWKHRYPIAAYLVAIAVTNYASYSHFASVDKTNTVEIVNYVYPENLESAKEQTAFTVKVMELFSELFIPYPFYSEKYGHAQFGWGGGMEHQTMSFMGNFSEHLITHELAHQWFGNHVTCNSWQHIWINEGFAVFGECVAEEHLFPENWLNWKRERMAIVLDKTTSGSIFVDDTTNVRRIFDPALSYQKGGLILQMLRDQVGDSAFFKGIQELLTNEKTSGGFASADDVRIFIEEAADTSLTAFFNDWYYGQGYPEYTLNWIQDLNNEVTLKISQTTTHNSVPFFALHVPLVLKGANTELNVRLHNTMNNENFSINADFVVTDIIFDPEYNIISPRAKIILGIEESGKDSHIKIMPNPADRSITIKTAKNIQLLKYDIIDLSGKQVYIDNQPDRSRKFHINIAPFPVGIYYLRIETNEGLVVKKFVKSN